MLLSIAVSCTASAPSALAAQTDDDAAASFAMQCAACHGANGSGDTVVGRSANIPDLRSPQVQQQPDAHLQEVIANGLGPMPQFGAALSDDQIQALVAYLRQLAKQK